MPRPEPPTVKLSFEGDRDGAQPHVILYNPEVLSLACRMQVNRFGVMGDGRTQLSGTLKGSRKTLTEMIMSYGNNVEVIRVRREIG